jgi:hypothetical protein
MRPALPAPHRNVATIWLVVALALALAAACGDEGPRHEPGGAPAPGVYVPSSWQEARRVAGHRVHVIGARVPCSRCHELTETSIGAVHPSSCATCHEKESRIEHARGQAEERFGAEAGADCTLCHGFSLDGTGHAPTTAEGDVPAATECRRCHAEAQGNTPAVEVHGTSACVSCHRPHDDARPRPGPCEGCHGEITTEHARTGKSPTEVCTTCHTHQHAPASDALGTCVACHGSTKPVVPATALFPEGHRECVGCHRPHDFEKAAAVPCRSCHEDVHVLGGRRVAAHRRCESCHAPHDVRGTPERACSGCHKGVHPDHPKHGAAGTCVGCHDPHPSDRKADVRVRSCSACHQTAATDRDFHGRVACTQCHRPHAFMLQLGDRATCQGCHGRQVSLASTLAGHTACEGCHRGLPHRPTRLGAPCAACHEPVQRVAHPGHSRCLQCHEPHGGKVTAECRSCHAAEHRTAPAGHHACANCHDTHSGRAARAACATCHATQAATPHGKLSGDCASCHRPHGPGGVAKPPPCTSCHKTSALPGLHQVSRHQACTQCHGNHGEVQATYRAPCLSCHTDRRNHFPEAPSCVSCHLFGPTR